MTIEEASQLGDFDPFKADLWQVNRYLHGPRYCGYSRYRDWIRDEFCFRCSVCWRREIWLGGDSFFELDHWDPVSVSPGRVNDYENMVYMCGSCNRLKGDGTPPLDPRSDEVEKHLTVDVLTGKVCATTESGDDYIKFFDLNDGQLVKFRLEKVRGILLALDAGDQFTLESILGFPVNLPCLKGKKPRRNTRRDSHRTAFRFIQSKGMLPALFICDWRRQTADAC